MAKRKPKSKHQIRGLNKRQRGLLQGVVEGKTIAEAGRDAGYSYRQNAHLAFKNIKLRFHPALERAGISLDKVLVRTISKQIEKLEAKETKFFQSDGEVTDERDVEAHAIQLDAARDLQRVIGLVADRGDDASSANPERAPHITINLAFLGPERAQAVLAAARAPDGGNVAGQPVLDAERDGDAG